MAGLCPGRGLERKVLANPVKPSPLYYPQGFSSHSVGGWHQFLCDKDDYHESVALDYTLQHHTKGEPMLNDSRACLLSP